MVTIQTIARREDLPYTFVSGLGGGGYSTVMEVKRRQDGIAFAMKVMYTQRRTRRILEETLREEVKIIRALEGNNHFIRVYEAYETPTEVGLILWPVADRRTLAACLEEYLDTPSSRDELRPVFEKAFGCLSSGLAYMHSCKIRHKDIKPANILVHAGVVLYSDFGNSLDSRLADSSTTEGPARTTRKYMAPEVIASEPRNSTSDIYSLGCVLIELVWALKRESEVDVTKFSEAMAGLRFKLESMKDTYCEDEACLLACILDMTHDAPGYRKSMAITTQTLCNIQEYCCDGCHIPRKLRPPLQYRTGGATNEWIWSKGYNRYGYRLDKDGSFKTSSNDPGFQPYPFLGTPSNRHQFS